MDIQAFYAHGKLLLTGEYAVLDGAKSLAIPTKYGQTLKIKAINETKNQIIWESFDDKNKKWLHAELPPQNYAQQEIATLQNIFRAIDKLNPSFFLGKNYHCQSFLEFPQNWGLGSSSTLIYMLAKWSNVNPFDLLEKTLVVLDMISLAQEQKHLSFFNGKMKHHNGKKRFGIFQKKKNSSLYI